MVLKARTKAPDWSADGDRKKWAKCMNHPLPTNHNVTPDTDPFFYDEEESAHICNGTYDDRVCPFREACLHRALVNNEQAGTFGGFTTEQRKWIRRERTLIPRPSWEESEEWRDLVPPSEYFAALKEAEKDGDEAEIDPS
jgi:hypothetical protein